MLCEFTRKTQIFRICLGVRPGSFLDFRLESQRVTPTESYSGRQSVSSRPRQFVLKMKENNFRKLTLKFVCQISISNANVFYASVTHEQHKFSC